MACITVEQTVATWLPFIATDTGTGDPRTGIVFTQVDVSYKKSTDSTFTSKVLTAPEFREIGLGVYEILFTGLELDTLGTFIYVVNNNGALPLPNIKQFVGQAFIQATAAYVPGTISLDTNILTGNLIDLSGAAITGASVSARVLEAPSIIGSSPNIGGIGTSIISAVTDSGGFFALELVQTAVVDVTIPSVNYRRTLTVPANSTDVLFEIP